MSVYEDERKLLAKLMYADRPSETSLRSTHQIDVYDEDEGAGLTIYTHFDYDDEKGSAELIVGIDDEPKDVLLIISQSRVKFLYEALGRALIEIARQPAHEDEIPEDEIINVGKEIWNAAIEAAISDLDKIGHCTDSDIERIRGLKK